MLAPSHQGKIMSQPASPRTTVRRKPDRGHYDAATIHAIIDAAFVCQIAFTHEGSVHCLPTACWRIGEHLYIHGEIGRAHV